MRHQPASEALHHAPTRCRSFRLRLSWMPPNGRQRRCPATAEEAGGAGRAVLEPTPCPNLRAESETPQPQRQCMSSLFKLSTSHAAGTAAPRAARAALVRPHISRAAPALLRRRSALRRRFVSRARARPRAGLWAWLSGAGVSRRRPCVCVCTHSVRHCPVRACTCLIRAPKLS